jgi:hypothetical protein
MAKQPPTREPITEPRGLYYNRYLRRWQKLKPIPRFSIPEILKWCDAFCKRHGRWPTVRYRDMKVHGTLNETWGKIDAALHFGLRGLEGGSSLARLLAKYRGVRNIHALPPLSVEQILKWADEHRKRTGDWPLVSSGPIPHSGGETWCAVDSALKDGRRRLEKSSLSKLLRRHRGKRSATVLSLTIGQVLRWAERHHKKTGCWPKASTSGLIDGGPGVTWADVNRALWKGHHGLKGGSSLGKLLVKHYRARTQHALPLLDLDLIIRWADAFHRKTGRWPRSATRGYIPGSLEDTWRRVDNALRLGLRGLKGGSSLARLLEQRRGVPNRLAKPRFRVEQILVWMDEHHRRTGRWPNQTSGAVVAAPGESWSGVETALSSGTRGLAGGSSIRRLLAKHRNLHNRAAPQRLTVKQILSWAAKHYRRTGVWPGRESGEIPETPGQTWLVIDKALRSGARGLSGGTTLARLIRENRARARLD